MSVSLPRRLFRIVRTNPPILRDFASHAVLGRQPRRPLTTREQDLWRGVSCYDSLAAAIDRARGTPWLGSFVAEIVTSDDHELRIEQTGRQREHYTVWAPADRLLSLVVSVTDTPQSEV